ncbi:single-stranded DNA-binding protein [Corynebacterium sp. P6129]|uniref:single-stranded DNA-binding protein n=1 Tax=Corynebacterium antarcticum TaxID=2800405 RepID=UPI002260C83A|nr:single-stranded DNA-binding protein [Corynebacterium antarcticum]MCX7491496.1 single-stranded DNA-binding protein [Corynebacterium antarcticum]
MIPFQHFTGRLVADPELRFTPSGKPVANFRIANSDSKKNDRGEWERKAQVFLSCTVWDDAEAVSNALHKGSEVVVEGKLVTREWDDKEGNKRSSMEVQVRHVFERIRDTQQQGTQGFGQQQAPQSSWSGGSVADSNEAPPF